MTRPCSVVVAWYSDGSGEPIVLGVWLDAKAADRFKNRVDQTIPTRVLAVIPSCIEDADSP